MVNGSSLNQFDCPKGLFVDQWSRIYVADSWNGRVMRWKEGEAEGEIIVGGDGRGDALNQLYFPTGLSFDLDGNLYVADDVNVRFLRFDLIV